MLKFRCNDCNETQEHEDDQVNSELKFTAEHTEDKPMGPERRHDAVIPFQCTCGREIGVTFEVWEYPLGIRDHDNIEIEGGELLEGFNPDIEFN